VGLLSRFEMRISIDEGNAKGRSRKPLAEVIL